MSKKSTKDYFDVAQLESHGPNHADDNPRKQVHVWRCINKNFARNLLLANRCSIFFQWQIFTKKAPRLVLGNIPVPAQRRTRLNLFLISRFIVNKPVNWQLCIKESKNVILYEVLKTIWTCVRTFQNGHPTPLFPLFFVAAQFQASTS